jgi:hypothetical protein
VARETHKSPLGSRFSAVSRRKGIAIAVRRLGDKGPNFEMLCE